MAEMVYTVMRTIDFRHGPRVVFPIQTYPTEEDALAQAKALTEALQGLLGLSLVEIAGQRQVKSSGMTAQNLLVDFGVTSFDHTVVPQPLSSSVEGVTPAAVAEEQGETVSEGGIILL